MVNNIVFFKSDQNHCIDHCTPEDVWKEMRGVSTANHAETGVSSETARPRVPLQNPNWCSKCVTQTLHKKPESPTVTLTWHVYKFMQGTS